MRRFSFRDAALGAFLVSAVHVAAQEYRPITDTSVGDYEMTIRPSGKPGVRFEVHAQGRWWGVNPSTPKEIVHDTFDVDEVSEIATVKACVDLGMGKLFVKTGKPGW